ncbi:MAG: PorV/PorQ family protein, partial [Calditrichales bacterium]
MRNCKNISLIVAMLLFSNLAYGTFNKAGRTSLQFLKIGVGARSAALGEACIANMYGINSAFWNPAALTTVTGGEAAFNYVRWIGDLDVMAAAIGYNIEGIGVFALNYTGLDYGDLEEALVTSPTGRLDTRTGTLFTGGDLSLGFSFARRFTDKLSIGVQLKYLREDLFEYSTSQWAIDVGSFYDTGWKGIKLAMTAQNFSKPARFLTTREEYEQTYELPLVFRIGWSIDLMGNTDLLFGGNPDAHKVTLNMDAVHTNDYAERLHVGVEYWLFNQFSLRTG